MITVVRWLSGWEAKHRGVVLDFLDRKHGVRGVEPGVFGGKGHGDDGGQSTVKQECLVSHHGWSLSLFFFLSTGRKGVRAEPADGANMALPSYTSLLERGLHLSAFSPSSSGIVSGP